MLSLTSRKQDLVKIVVVSFQLKCDRNILVAPHQATGTFLDLKVSLAWDNELFHSVLSIHIIETAEIIPNVEIRYIHNSSQNSIYLIRF